MAKSYGALRVLRGVSFDIRQGEILVLLGLNGAGKSTLLEGMAGLAAMDAGVLERVVSGGPLSVASDERHHLLFFLPEGIDRPVFGAYGPPLRFDAATRRITPLAMEDSAHVDMRRDVAALPPLGAALCAVQKKAGR